MPNFNIQISDQLLSEFNGANDYIWAIAYAGNSPYTLPTANQYAYNSITYTNVVEVASAGQLDLTTAISLPSGNDLTRVYLVAQHGNTSNIPPYSASETDLDNPSNAVSGNYTYQLFEFDFNGGDADISGVNQTGMTSYLQVDDSYVGYVGSTADVFNAIAKFATASGNPGGTVNPDVITKFSSGSSDYNLAVGPSNSPLGPTAYPSEMWTSYVDAVFNNPGAIQLSWVDNGNAALNSPAFLEAFTTNVVTWTNSNSELVHGLEFRPLYPGMPVSGASDLSKWRISRDNLLTNLSNTGGANIEYYDQTSSTWVSESPSANDQYSTAASILFCGFNAGLWGSTGTNPNNQSSSVNLSQPFNWQWYYEYGATVASKGINLNEDPGHPNVVVTNYLANQNGDTFGPGQWMFLSPGNYAWDGKTYYSGYTSAIEQYSNIYGNPYSDYLQLGGLNPQIYQTPNSDVTIHAFGYDETPTNIQQPPSGYLLPTGAGGNYSPANTVSSFTTTSNTLQLQTFTTIGPAGTQQYNLYTNQNWQYDFKFYNPGSSQAVNGFVSLDLNEAGNGNPFQIFNLQQDATTHEFSLADIAPFGSLAWNSGFRIQGLPITETGDAAWMQIQISAPGASGQTVASYDFYNTYNSTTGVVTTYGPPLTVVAGESNNYNAIQGGEPSYNPILFFNPNQVIIGIEFQMLLNRTTDQGGMNWYTGLLDTGKLTQTGLANDILTSLEYKTLYPDLSNTEFVENCFEFGLGRAPDAAGLAWYREQLHSGAMTRADVVVSITNSPEMWSGSSVSVPQVEIIAANNSYVASFPDQIVS